ncbi:unnamed protein product, partial [Mesorhabditis spiculigera]
MYRGGRGGGGGGGYNGGSNWRGRGRGNYSWSSNQGGGRGGGRGGGLGHGGGGHQNHGEFNAAQWVLPEMTQNPWAQLEQQLRAKEAAKGNHFALIMDALDPSVQAILARADARKQELRANSSVYVATSETTGVEEKSTSSPVATHIKARFAALEEQNNAFEYTEPKRATKENTPSPRKSMSNLTNVDLFSPKAGSPRKSVDFAKNQPTRKSFGHSETTVDENNKTTAGMHLFLVDRKSIGGLRTPPVRHLHEESTMTILAGNQTTMNQSTHSPPEMSPDFRPLRTSSPIREPAQAPKSFLNSCLKSAAEPKPMAKTAVFEANKPRIATYHTQWRGAAETPVAKGQEAGTPEKPIPSANLQNLRQRWEFATKCGTPLHPENSENDLLKAAKHLAETCIPAKKFVSRLPHLQKFNQPGLQPVKPILKHSSPKTSREPTVSMVVEEGLEKEADFIPEKEGEVFEETDLESTMPSDDEETPGVHALEELYKDELGQLSPLKPASPPKAADETLTPVREEAKPSPIRTFIQQKPVEPIFNAPLPPENPPDSGLVHSVSFYRRTKAAPRCDEKVEKVIFAGAEHNEFEHSPFQSVPNSVRQEIAAETRVLEERLAVQTEQIQQAIRALEFCRTTPEFAGSREEVDAQRALLVATETKRACIAELRRLEDPASVRQTEGIRGEIRLANVAIPLSREFISGLQAYSAEIDIMYYFTLIVRCGSEVMKSEIVSSEDALYSNGCITFPNTWTFKNLRPDFNCIIEVFALRSRKENLSHEEKYRIKGGTFRGALYPKVRSPAPSTSRGHAKQIESGFQHVGGLELRINTPEQPKYRLGDAQHPLQGEIQLRLKKCSVGKGSVSHRAFLSLHQKSQGLAAWSRYWCTLENGEMKFWRNPEDELGKNCAAMIDLTTCSTEGAVAEPHGNYPHSFHLDVWVPKEKSEREMEKLRILMAADHKEGLAQWIDTLNKAIKNLLMWNTTHR